MEFDFLILTDLYWFVVFDLPNKYISLFYNMVFIENIPKGSQMKRSIMFIKLKFFKTQNIVGLGTPCLPERIADKYIWFSLIY